MAEDKNTIGSAKVDPEMKEKVKSQIEDEGGTVVNIDDIVTFEFKYPKEYLSSDGKTPKKKHFSDGDKQKLHRITAKHFQDDLKIGKILE